MRWFIIFVLEATHEEIDRLLHRAECFQSWARLTREIFHMSDIFLRLIFFSFSVKVEHEWDDCLPLS